MHRSVIYALIEQHIDMGIIFQSTHKGPDDAHIHAISFDHFDRILSGFHTQKPLGWEMHKRPTNIELGGCQKVLQEKINPSKGKMNISNFWMGKNY